MLIRKLNPGAGSAIRWHDGNEYAWPADNPVCDVPEPLGQDLLRIGGHEQVRPEPEKPARTARKAGNAATSDAA